MMWTRLRPPTVGTWLGPLAAVCLLVFADLDPERASVTAMAAVAVWMAVWWMTEAVPLAITALLPVALYPLLGIMSGKAVAPYYFNSIIFLFLGGFMVALAMERWNLHRRIALRIITLVGGGPNRIVLGFMLAAAFLSMWISNTATAMMMAPIALAVVKGVGHEDNRAETRRFAVALLLGTAYGCSVGGLATLIGTPPNPLLVSNLGLLFPDAPEISFAGWMVIGLPVCIVMLAVIWMLLTAMFGLRRMEGLIDHRIFVRERDVLGPPSFEEKVVFVDFVLLAVLWLTRTGLRIGDIDIPGWSALLPDGTLVDDGTVAIVMALLLFVVPSRNIAGRRVMDWRTARKLPWAIVLLFGGGFALAKGFVDAGLSDWLGERMTGLSDLPPVLMILCICLIMTFLTELTSNTATTQMALPVVASVAIAVDMNPLLLMVPATLSASCAFMLPVATPPNAIIFGTEMITIREMARAGLLLNIVGALVITAAIYVLGAAAFGGAMDVTPAWAVTP
jgi:solute carrier family 13 (sodium-dependent dicarboxylate transporter), member 2/3/5